MIGVEFTIGSVGVRVGVGAISGSLVDCGSGVTGKPVSGSATSTVGTDPPPMDVTAAGVSVGEFSPPGGTNVGEDAERGDKEQARLTPATNNPANGINLYQELRLIIIF